MKFTKRWLKCKSSFPVPRFNSQDKKHQFNKIRIRGMTENIGIQIFDKKHSYAK